MTMAMIMLVAVAIAVIMTMVCKLVSISSSQIPLKEIPQNSYRVRRAH